MRATNNLTAKISKYENTIQVLNSDILGLEDTECEISAELFTLKLAIIMAPHGEKKALKKEYKELKTKGLKIQRSLNSLKRKSNRALTRLINNQIKLNTIH